MNALRFLDRYARAGRRVPVPQCELCAEPLEDRHGHVVDLEARSIGCACRSCTVLFREPGGRYRTVPDRIQADPRFRLGADDRAALGIPVGLAFCFYNSARESWIAVYPSPAGPTEVDLDNETWARVTAGSALVASIEPDVEALLFHAPSLGAEPAWLLVPIDVCYELVAVVRRHWTGFDGGDGRAAVAARIGDLRSRARPLDTGGKA